MPPIRVSDSENGSEQMRYSKTTLRELSASYTRILKKCAYLNALIFMSSALLTTGAKATIYPADGAVIDTDLTDSYEIASGKTVEFTGANAEGLSAGYGGAIENSGTLNINDFTFTGNTATAGYGGAVDNYGGTVTISGQSSFTGNTSPITNGVGGAISNDGGSAVLTINEGASFSGNSSTNGGAIYTATTATITGASFEGNEASYGGSLFSSGTTTITGVNGVDTFKNNNATVYGGAIIGYTGGDLTINNATFTGNTATSYAGGIYSDGTLTIKDSIFDGNSAAQDGAVTDTSGATGGMCITNTIFQNNHANSVGALGLYSKNATSTLDNVQFISNSAINGGSGAAFVGAQGQVIINGAIFDSNTATLAGGAIGTRAHEVGDDSGAKLDISKTTFTGNTAGTNGGAISNYLYNDAAGDGYVKVTDSTFTSNSAENGGAIYNHKGTSQTGSVYLSNTTFTDNTATTAGGAIYNEGTLTLSGTQKFIGNTATLKGGAIYNSGTLTIGDGAFFQDNISLGEGSTLGHGSDIYNDHGIVVIGDNLTVERTSVPAGHDCAIYSPNGGDVTIGNNAKFTGIKEAVVVGGGTHVIGDNAIFTNNRSSINIHSTGTTFTLGKNALFENNPAWTLSTNDGSNATVRIGDGFTLQNNENISTSSSDNFALLYNGKGKSTFEFLGSSTFRNNLVHQNAGVIQNWSYIIFDGDATFENNNAAGNGSSTNGDGGALRNRYGSFAPTATFNGNATFTGNNANYRGGAIFNDKGQIAFNQKAIFENNTAAFGSAIFNDKGTITFESDATFSGNKDQGELNDIYNNQGTLTFKGNTTLDGGIAGSGTTIFTDTASLTVNGGTTTISNTVENQGASLSFVFDKNFSEDTYQLVTGSLDTEFTLNSNALFDITTTDTNGTYAIAKKSSENIAEAVVEAGGTANQAATIAAVATSDSDHPVAQALSESLQTNPSEATKAAEELAPDTSDNVMGVAQAVITLIADAATNRIDILGRSGGDTFTGGNVWVQGLYNHSKQDASQSTTGFKANTAGVAFGLDGKVNDALTLGVGYGYTYTHSHAGSRRLNIDGHNVFVYGAYQPDAWYVHTLAAYGFNPYEEKKAPMGVTFKSKYDVSTYALNVMTGYDFANGLSPEIGARYLLAKQDAYFDGLQRVASNNTDVLTGVVGVKYKTSVQAKDWTFKPTLRLAATYDLHSSDSTAHVTLPGGSSYQIVGERLKRFGVETGVGLETTLKDWTVGLEYTGNFRKDYQSHTGMLKAKYAF